MHTTYHLDSAQELTTDILNAIKATCKSKPITIKVEEDEVDLELTTEMKTILEERLQEDENTYTGARDSLIRLRKK